MPSPAICLVDRHKKGLVFLLLNRSKIKNAFKENQCDSQENSVAHFGSSYLASLFYVDGWSDIVDDLPLSHL